MIEQFLTPRALAAKLGISPSTVRAILRRKHPKPAQQRFKRWAIPQEWASEIEAERGRPEQRRLVARVVSQKGTCAAGHKVGDQFSIGDKTPPRMCSWAFYAMFPLATVLRFGGSFPWEESSNRTTVACPDPENPVTFELRRL